MRAGVNEPQALCRHGVNAHSGRGVFIAFWVPTGSIGIGGSMMSPSSQKQKLMLPNIASTLYKHCQSPFQALLILFTSTANPLYKHC